MSEKIIRINGNVDSCHGCMIENHGGCRDFGQDMVNNGIGACTEHGGKYIYITTEDSENVKE